MKIAFIGQKGIPVSQGGVERHVEEIARRLAARGHTVLAYSRKTYAKGDSVLPANIKVIDLPSVPLKAWDSIVHVMLSSIDVLFRDVDVIHYQSMGPAFFMVIPWLFKPKARLVFTHHTFEKQRPQWGMLSKLSMALGEWVGVHLADRVIATGSIIADDLKARYGRPVEVIVNGGTFNATKSDTAVELPQKYILAVSRLISSKGLDHLINAFNLIAADYPLYHLVIVGSATHNDNVEPELRALAAENPKIHFLGQQPSSALGAIYENADLFVQPSELEGLPMTLLEAASQGIPTIISDIPEHTSIMAQHGVRFKNKNHFDLAAKMRSVLDNMEVERGNAKLMAAFINREYNWDTVSERVESIYRSIPAKGYFRLARVRTRNA